VRNEGQRFWSSVDQFRSSFVSAADDSVQAHADEDFGEAGVFTQRCKVRPDSCHNQPRISNFIRFAGDTRWPCPTLLPQTQPSLSGRVGLDMSRWKTEAHLASWLGLCPDNRISGDKVLARGTRHVLNRAATALRLGASTLLRQHAGSKTSVTRHGFFGVPTQWPKVSVYSESSARPVNASSKQSNLSHPIAVAFRAMHTVAPRTPQFC
jgi:hypothetical protein